jgi:hypothetical protein
VSIDAASGPRPIGVDLWWIPVGADTPVVAWSARTFESINARLGHRPRFDLYHAALEVYTNSGRHAIEQAPVPDRNGVARGVVAVGPVGIRAAGRFRWFRYEVRCWPDGVIPDLARAVGGPRRVSNDASVATRLLAELPHIPTPVWGRDEAGLGEMWNSNSVVAWALTTAGIDADSLHPPVGGRAPGWRVGCALAESPCTPLRRPTTPGNQE